MPGKNRLGGAVSICIRRYIDHRSKVPRVRAILKLVTVAALLLTAACGPADAPAKAPLVLAASSLQDALTEAAQSWTARGHAEPVLSFAATPALARQIEAGAPADLFVSADEQWMDELQAEGRTKPETRRDLLGNALVLIAPSDSTLTLATVDAPSLTRALGSGRLALADPDAVPAGRYARQALTKLGAWQAVAGRVVPAENVRQALTLVARKEAALGVVYATDAKAEPKVRVVHAFALDSHAPIVYPAALLKAGTSAEAAPFLAFLGSAQASAIFRKHGFTLPAAR